MTLAEAIVELAEVIKQTQYEEEAELVAATFVTYFGEFEETPAMSLAFAKQTLEGVEG